MTDRIPPVSNSELMMFADCPRRWWFTYVLNRGLKRAEVPVTGALAFGTRIHACLERKYQNGEHPLDVYEELHAEAERALTASETARGVPDSEQRRKLADEHSLGRAMLEGYEEWAAETGLDEGLTFIGAEKTVEVPSGYENVRLRGKLDQVWRRDIDGALLFRDFKTAADMRSGPSMLARDEQMMFYIMLMRLDRLQRGENTDGAPRGGMYTMLKKVKRTGRAAPPFYAQHEIMFNDRALGSMWLRTHRRLRQMLDIRDELDSGQPHQYVVPPRPTRDCAWKCPFVAICPMADDSPDETLYAVLDQLYEKVDPYERYGDEETTVVLD